MREAHKRLRRVRGFPWTRPAFATVMDLEIPAWAEVALLAQFSDRERASGRRHESDEYPVGVDADCGRRPAVGRRLSKHRGVDSQHPRHVAELWA